MARRSHLRCDQARNNACAACDVECALSCAKRALRHEDRCPGSKDGGHELSLVDLWSIAAELPPLRLIHLRLLCEQSRRAICVATVTCDALEYLAMHRWK